jgi:hypothetical protein
MKRRLRAPSPAFVIALIALFVALGGTSYAAINALPKNSVGTKQLKKNAVTGVKIKNKAVTASKINTAGLTVPNATHAASADSATSATTAGSAAPSGAAGGALAGSYPNPGLAPIEAWHEVGASGEPAFQSGWSNFGGFSTMAFAKDSAGFVHLKGTVSAGTFAAPVFTLPAGYRPAQNLAVPVAIERDALIFTTGVVEIFQSGAETNAGFDGLSFKAGG